MGAELKLHLMPLVYRQPLSTAALVVKNFPGWFQTADRIVAVSPNYAQEILTPEYGCGLEKMLKTRQKSISGIVNGLDQESWDPATDPCISVNYNLTSFNRREQNKTALTKEFSFDPNLSIPLLILISRMDQQKGVDSAIEGLHRAIKFEWQSHSAWHR
jgi:starch synthase